MLKKRIFQKQKESSKSIYPKKGILAEPYNPGDDLTIKDFKEGIEDAFASGDYDTLQGAIALLLKKCDLKKITKETGLSKKALEKMCIPYPPPDYTSVNKILKFLTNEIQNPSITDHKDICA